MAPKSGNSVPRRSPAGLTAAARDSSQRHSRLATLPLAAALAVVALTYWSVDIVSPALPEIKEDLGLSAAGAGLVFSFLFLGRLLGNFPATYFLERSGAPVAAAGGGLLLAAGSAMALVAPGSEFLLVARMVQGAGISLVVNAGLRSILVARPGRGIAMTYFGIAATFGGVFGLQIGGALTESSGWRSIFVLSSTIGIVVAALGLSFSRSHGTSNSAPTKDQARSPVPAVPIRELAAPLVINFMVFANYSIWVALPLYAERTFGATPNSTANLLMVITIVHLLAAMPVGTLIARIGSETVLVMGMLVSLIGTVSVLAAPGLLWMGVPLVLYGAGQVAAVNAGGDIVLQRGNASNKAIGYVRLSSDFGLVIGPIVAGAMADRLGYGAPFAVLPVVMATTAIATAIGLIVRPRRLRRSFL